MRSSAWPNGCPGAGNARLGGISPPHPTWVVVAWPSDPASPSSHPPSPPAKLVHGKCSLTSFPKTEPGLSTSCCPLLCQLRAKEGRALQTSSSLSHSRSVSGPVGPFKALWVLDSTWNFTQSCLGSQGGVLDTGSASWAPSQPRAPLPDRLWGEPRSGGRLGLGHIHGNVGVLVSTRWGRSGVRFSPCGFLGILRGFLIFLVEGTRPFFPFYGPACGLAGVPGGYN